MPAPESADADAPEEVAAEDTAEKKTEEDNALDNGGKKGRTILLKELIRDIPDFPKEGIIFKDITPVLQSPAGLKEVVNKFSEHYASQKVDVIVGAEARGFLFVPQSL